MSKITDYPETTTLPDGSFLDVSKKTSTDPAPEVFESNKIEKRNFIKEVLGYVYYICQIGQTSTNAPVEVFNKNTTGISPSWVRDSVGVYSLDFTGIVGTFFSPYFTDYSDKATTIVVLKANGTTDIAGQYLYYWDDTEKKVYLYSFDNVGGEAELNTIIGNSKLYLPEIRFYI